MALLYLEALQKHRKLGFLSEEIERLQERYIGVTDALLRVSQVLRKSNLNYAFFKTIRPYREVTVDLDVLVLGSDYYQAVKNLQKAGYALLEGDSYSSTRARNEVVTCLNPIADLLCLVAHSVIKEQMYVLSEYYTSLYYLSQMENADVDEFLGLIEECWLRFAASTHLTVTAFTHYSVHGFLPSKLAKIMSEIGVNQKELSRIDRNCFSMPYKFHMLTFVEALLEKFREKRARRSLAYQALNLLNPSFTATAFCRMLDHLTRKTY